jgi:ABC-2 type transport system permease protein
VTDVVKLLRWELYKLARQRASYIGFVLSLVFTVVMLIGFGMSDFKMLRSMRNLGFDPMSLINGPFFANFTLNIGFFAVLPLLAATLGGSQLAGEAKDGSLRALMLRPPSRTAVYAAKVIATWIWLQLNVFFMVALALLVGTVAFGGGELLVFVYEFRKAGPWIVDAPDWVALVLVVSLGAGASLFVISALSLLLTTVTDSPVVAHVGTLGAFFISSVIQRLPDELISDEVRDALPTKHMNFWHELYRLWRPGGGFDAARFWGDVAWCGGFTAVSLAVGLYAFVRKDVTS